MSTHAAGKKPRQWVSLVPYGIGEQHPNAYKDIVTTAWENRDNLGYAWRILNNGCCDGCALGTKGMRDWTMKGVHLCAVRLQLLRLNTMPAMDWRKLEDAGDLQGLSEKQLRQLGRLAVPMVRRRGEKGFRRVAWDEAIATVAEGLRAADPHRVAWYITSRGLTNEAYY
ncbi:MAG TPA: molybdopterin-dependent oxidoreductase, partial [Terriglobales bacterium]|nr:molybdopterin-dependent oxidoreductase [Terriglobales bacterium]